MHYMFSVLHKDLPHFPLGLRHGELLQLFERFFVDYICFFKITHNLHQQFFGILGEIQLGQILILHNFLTTKFLFY